jgi:hypothetical protein
MIKRINQMMLKIIAEKGDKIVWMICFRLLSSKR